MCDKCSVSNILEVANYFIEKSKKDNDSNLTHMKLQKLLYFAHGWHLALTSKPLVDSHVEAWEYGPVFYDLYRYLKASRNEPINELISTWVFGPDMTKIEKKPHIPEDSETEGLRHFLDVIWEKYGAFSPIQLSNSSHEEGGPWHQIFSQCNGSLPPRAEISNDLIREYFEEVLKGAQLKTQKTPSKKASK